MARIADNVPSNDEISYCLITNLLNQLLLQLSSNSFSLYMCSRPFGWWQCWIGASHGEFHMCFLTTLVYEYVLDCFVSLWLMNMCLIVSSLLVLV
jgi:hypothetical protein